MKKTLNWRLKDLPDAVDIAELVDKKVITPEEARQLLFNEGKDEGNKVKELEEEVRFLRELCDKLAAKTSGGWPTIVHEYRDYRPKFPTWYSAYGGVINTVGTTSNLTTSTAGVATAGYTLGTGTATTKGLSSLN